MQIPHLILTRILRPSIILSAWQLILLAPTIPGHAYYMDDTNSSIVYSGSKWSRITSNVEPWVENSEIYFATLTHSVCETTDDCNVLIPFRGSGITIYNVIRSSMTVGITIDGQSSTYNFADNNSCLNATNSGCFNTSIYDAQYLPYGDYNVTISMFTVPQSSRNLLYSDFYLDYVSVNDTRTEVTSPSPVISPVPTTSPTPTNSTTPSSWPTASPHPPSGRHLSPGAVAGIVIGALCALVFHVLLCRHALCIFASTWWEKTRWRRETSPNIQLSPLNGSRTTLPTDTGPPKV